MLVTSIFSFPTVFSKTLFFKVVRSWDCAIGLIKFLDIHEAFVFYLIYYTNIMVIVSFLLYDRVENTVGK